MAVLDQWSIATVFDWAVVTSAGAIAGMMLLVAAVLAVVSLFKDLPNHLNETLGDWALRMYFHF